MLVFRVVSDEEFEYCKEFGLKTCLSHGKKGRLVFLKWFSSSPEYIVSILKRGMFKGQKSSERSWVLISEIRGHWIPKKELGVWNFGLITRQPFFIDWYVWLSSDEFLALFEKKFERPILYYWNKFGELRKFFSRNDLRNISSNSDLSVRPWFVRADFYRRLVP